MVVNKLQKLLQDQSQRSYTSERSLNFFICLTQDWNYKFYGANIFISQGFSAHSASHKPLACKDVVPGSVTYN